MYVPVRGIIEQEPVERALVVPLYELRELAAHKQQFFARVRHHKTEEGLEPLEFFLVFAGHFIYERTLAVHHLVVRKRKYVIFRKRVGYGKSDVVVHILAEERICRNVAQHIVHPAHVPLEVEAQTAHIRAPCDHGESGGLFRYHKRARVHFEHIRVQLFQKVYGFKIVVAAEGVRAPLLPAVVQIKHTRHRVHAYAVYVVFRKPEGSGRKQEGHHLLPAVVEHHRAPLPVLGFERVGVLVKRLAVKVVKSVLVLGKVRRHPVQNNAYARLVHDVHEIFEVVGRAVTRGGREHSRHLVSPRTFEGIFGYGQNLHVRVAHLLHVIPQLHRQVAVGKRIAVVVFAPRTYVDFVNVHGRRVRVGVCAGGHPLAVRPFVRALVKFGTRCGGSFAVQGVRVRFHDLFSVRLGHAELINVVHFQPRHERFPYTVRLFQQFHGIRFPVPAVEVADHGNGARVRRPDAEKPAVDALYPRTAGRKQFVGFAVISFVKQKYGEIRIFTTHLSTSTSLSDIL